LAAALKSGRRLFSHALLLLPDRVAEALEAGDWETADRLLLLACNEVSAAAPAGARLFRWSAGSLLALLEGDPPAVPASGWHRTFPLSQARDTPRLFRTLDACVALGSFHPGR
jgi:hypothetical protein